MTALRGLEARLRLARLYLCTDAREQQGDLADFLGEVLAGGVDVVQIWQPGLSEAAERRALEVARHAAQRHQALVAVHADVGLAGRWQPDVLHLDVEDRRTAAARRAVHPQVLLGRSALDEQQVAEAVEDAELDYFSIGPVFASPSKPDAAPAGLALVRAAAAAAAAPVYDLGSKPWFAVGGITADNVDQVLAGGARRVVVVSALTRAGDPRAAASEISGALREAWRADPESARYTFAAAASTGR